jgi:RNA polymerase sigma factor (sigma-70 family)
MSRLAAVNISPGRRARVAFGRDALIENHIGLVPPIARRVQSRLPPSFEYDDLFAEGCVGLIRAADRYNPASHGGTPFSAFARPRIHGAIVDSVRRKAWIENTANPLDDAPEGSAVFPLPFLICGPVLAGPKRRAGTPHAFRSAHLPKRLTTALRRLTARQRAILGAFYGDAGSLDEIAATLHITPDRANAEHTIAIDALRAALLQNVSKSGLGLANFTLEKTLDRLAA